MKLYFCGGGPRSHRAVNEMLWNAGARKILWSFWYAKGTEMKLYFAGSESWISGDFDPRFGAGVRNFLQSYYHMKARETPELLKREEVSLLVDSGGFTARTRGVVISVEQYAKWINDNGIKLAFNLDTNDVGETLGNQSYLEKYCPDCYIIPIYHLSDFQDCRELIQDFAARYPYISIGGVVGERSKAQFKDAFYAYTFRHTTNRVKVHGLGITGRGELERYPFYSVDSTSWLSAARFGRSLFEKDQKLTAMRARTRHFVERTTPEIKNWLVIEKQVTDLWRARGIDWKEK